MAANDDIDDQQKWMLRNYELQMKNFVRDVHSVSRAEAKNIIESMRTIFDHNLRPYAVEKYGLQSETIWQGLFGPYAKALGIVFDEYPDLVDELYDGRTLLADSMYTPAYHDDYRYMLLQRGAGLGTVDEDGRTTVMYAAYAGRLQFVKMAAARGVDLKARDNDGETIFHHIFYDNEIVRHGFDVLDFLLSLGLNPNGVDNYGFSPLSHMLVQRHGTGMQAEMRAVNYFSEFYENFDDYRQKIVNTMVQAYERGLRPIMPAQYRKNTQQTLQSLMQFADNPEVIQQMILYLNQEPVAETNAGQATNTANTGHGYYLAI